MVSTVAVAHDRLRALVDVLIATLDDHLDGEQVARRAFVSRFHFDRLVTAGLSETPAAFRRRLLLERAAWQIAKGHASVLEAGMDAGYGSGEAFTRAFRRAFGAPPTAYAGSFRIDAPNGIHFHPPAGMLFAGPIDRSTTMDLADRMLEHDLDEVRRLLDQAAGLDDAALDEIRRPGNHVMEFDGKEETAREMLDKLVSTKEVWVAAVNGDPMPDRDDVTIAGLRARLDSAGPAFLAVARRIRDEGTWDHAFVDALCEPPQSFSFGSVVAHVLTYSAHRRHVLAAVLRELGIGEAEAQDPINWELGRAA